MRVPPSLLQGRLCRGGANVALFADDRVKGRQVHVTTKDHVLTLRGKVDSAEAKSAASDVAKGIEGVKDVKNGIEDTISGPAITFYVDQSVAARSGFTPQEIEVDASALLQGEPAPNPTIVKTPLISGSREIASSALPQTSRVYVMEAPCGACTMNIR